MAGKKLKEKIRASSILEVVVSMVVIVLVFGIAMMIYSNVLRISLSGKHLRAQALLRERIFKLMSASGDTAQNSADEFYIRERDQPWEGSPELTDIDLVAIDRNHEQIAELRQVITNYKP